MARIADALWDLRELYRSEPNPERRQELQDEYDRCLIAVADLADKNLNNNTKAFEEAVDALDAANTALRDARKKIAGVAQAITKIAKAVSAIVKVAKMAV